MNFFERLALLFGFRRFESYVQSQPELPDDTLQVAATLDSHTTRTGLLMIAGSLAHAIVNLLHGTETADQLTTHLLISLSGIGLVFARHAVSANEVKINAGLQQARAKLGIAPVVVKTASVIALMFAILFFTPLVHADTNSILDAGAVQIASNASPVSAQIALPKLTLIERLPLITNAWTLVSSVFQVLTVDGIYSAISDGERGAGIATLAAIVPINTSDNGMRLLLGPAMVTVESHVATRAIGELGITSKILNGAIVQSTLLKVPVLGAVIKATTLDFTEFYFFAGGGENLNADVNHLDRGITGSLGGGGIGFGKGANG